MVEKKGNTPEPANRIIYFMKNEKRKSKRQVNPFIHSAEWEWWENCIGGTLTVDSAKSVKYYYTKNTLTDWIPIGNIRNLDGFWLVKLRQNEVLWHIHLVSSGIYNFIQKYCELFCTHFFFIQGKGLAKVFKSSSHCHYWKMHIFNSFALIIIIIWIRFRIPNSKYNDVN